MTEADHTRIVNTGDNLTDTGSASLVGTVVLAVPTLPICNHGSRFQILLIHSHLS